MRIIVGICTLNRPDDLDITLRSLVNNFKKPDLLVVIDQSSNDDSSFVVEKYNEVFPVAYHKVNFTGLTKARNFLLDNTDFSDDDVILFLDDDVTLNSKYLGVLENTFCNFDICGFQGLVTNGLIEKGLIRKSREIFRSRIFKFPAVSFYRPKVDNLGINRYPLFPPRDKIIDSEWLSGCNMAYRIGCIRGKTFNESFILYGLMEDVEYSYSLFKNGHKLVMNTSATLIHRVSKKSRIPKKSELLMRLGYRRYLISTLLQRRVERVYSQYVKALKRSGWRENPHFLEADSLVMQLSGEIDQGNLNSLNEHILSLAKEGR